MIQHHGRIATFIRQALTVLVNLRHRGACGCEANTGDGAGILMQTPHEFLKKVCAREKIALPSRGEYGVGMVYLPPDKSARYKCEKLFEEIVENEGHRLLGWRTVPTNNKTLGETARLAEPFHFWPIFQKMKGKGRIVPPR